MKLIQILVSALLIVNAPIFSQSDYEPLIDTTKQWNILNYVYRTDAFEELRYINTIAERFKGDTLIVTTQPAVKYSQY
jgi:hypothetical protein